MRQDCWAYTADLRRSLPLLPHHDKMRHNDNTAFAHTRAHTCKTQASHPLQTGAWRILMQCSCAPAWMCLCTGRLSVEWVGRGEGKEGVIKLKRLGEDELLRIYENRHRLYNPNPVRSASKRQTGREEKEDGGAGWFLVFRLKWTRRVVIFIRMKMGVVFLLFSMSIMISQTAVSEYKAIRFNAGENDDFCCCVANFKGSVSPLLHLWKYHSPCATLQVKCLLKIVHWVPFNMWFNVKTYQSWLYSLCW